MVEKKVAYNRGAPSEGFDDNDPLAELTRIVGHDDRPPHPVAAPSVPFGAPRPPMTERRDPEFNLEDELLREFEVYDAPSDVTDPALVEEMPAPAGQFLRRVEALFEPAVSPPPARFSPATPGDLAALRRTAPVVEREEELRADMDMSRDREPAFDPADIGGVTAAAFSAAARDRGIGQTAAPGRNDAYGRGEAAIVSEPLLSPDIADALESAVAASGSVQTPVPTPGAGRRSSLEFSGLRLPLANFGAAIAGNGAAGPPVAARATIAPAPVPAEPAPMGHAALAVEPAPFTASSPVIVESASSRPTPAPSMDALVRDVARYPIGQGGRPDVLGRAPKPVDVGAFSERAATERPLDASPAVSMAAAARAAALARVLPASPSRVAPVPPQGADSVALVAAPTVADELDVFNDPDFELALDDIDIDIDFSDIGNIDIDAKPAAAPLSIAAPPGARPVSRPAIPQGSAGYARAGGEARTAAAPESLPFDPFQIGETGDQPEALAEMDVPELPAAMLEQKPAPRRPDEDLDLDTELATLFTPAAGGLDRQKGTGGRAPVPTRQEVDEFERALEQDFRRSMQEAAENRANAPRYAPTPVQQARLYNYNEPGRPRRFLLPAAATLGLVLIGGGGYALLFSSPAEQGAGGAPVIISADNEPMKVAPDNPGGRVVPNQNQAVYKSVAGNGPTDPKQPSLLSTNEQPVDVVQRTLVPEQLPLEDEDDSGVEAGTPVGETEDPRLLSPHEQQQAGAESGGSPVNVTPRKVRTMIVKPDGTLVAQETEGSAATTRAAASRPAVPPPAEAQVSPPPSAVAQAALQASPERSSALPDNTVAAQGNLRAAAPPPAAQAVPVAAVATTGEYYIQIASLPSEAEAQKSYQSLSAKFGAVIGGRGVDIKAAEIAGKGTFYRVRIPAGDKNEAAALCERLRAAGGSCLIAR